jgi:hypothetical protein
MMTLNIKFSVVIDEPVEFKKITASSSRLVDNCRSCWRILWNIPQFEPKDHNMEPIGLGKTRILTRLCPKISRTLGAVEIRIANLHAI